MNTVEPMPTVTQTPAETPRSLVMTIISGLMFGAAALILFAFIALFMIKIDSLSLFSVLHGLVQMNTPLHENAPGLLLIIATAIFSFLGNIVFGISLFKSLLWTRIGTVIFLGLQLLAILTVLHLLVKVPAVMGGFFVDPMPCYWSAGIASLIHLTLIGILLRVRR